MATVWLLVFLSTGYSGFGAVIAQYPTEEACLVAKGHIKGGSSLWAQNWTYCIPGTPVVQQPNVSSPGAK